MLCEKEDIASAVDGGSHDEKRGWRNFSVPSLTFQG